MRLSQLMSIGVVTVVSASLVVPTAAAATSDGDVTEYLVVSSGGPASVATTQLPGDVREQYPNVGAAVVEMSEQEAEALSRQPGLVVSENGRMSVAEVKPGGEALDVSSTRVVADKELGTLGRTAESWGIDRVDQRTGTNGVYRARPGVDGSGVHVYVIDTGLAVNHPEFAGRVGNGKDFVRDGNGVKDCNGHGTHVAGIIGSNVFGVAPGATIHPVRVLGCDGYGYWSDFIAALNWVKANAPRASVANASVGGYYDPAVNQAVNNFVNSGTPLVVAAGNEADAIYYYSPASAVKATTVMATDPDDGESYYTNFGPEADMFAPGTDIWSTYYRNPSKKLRMSGTSMAAPHVAGYMALRLQHKRGESVSSTKQALYSQSSKGVVDTYFGGYPDDLVHTYQVRAPLKVQATTVKNRTKLKLNVDPDVAAKSWKVVVQKKTNRGWTKVKTVRTQGKKETKVLDVRRGTYRVVVPKGQHGYSASKTSSNKVFIRR